MKKPADPILIEVLRNEMGAIAEEMAIAVYKTARSSMLRVGDFATSLADYQGRIVGLGQSHTMATSVFMHLMPHITRKFAGDLKPGDVILANDPYSGASHMPDVILIMPVFHRAQISGFVIIYSHQTDIGGRFPGGFSSQCTETYEEGIRLPNLKLYEAGVRNEPLVQLLKANIRAADEWMGDIDAKLSGCRRGIRDFEAVLEKYGLDDVNACFDYLVDYAEEAARKAIATVPAGDYSREIFMRDDGFGSEGVAMPIRLTLRFRPDRLVVDFTGTAPQARGAINMPFSNTLGQVYSTVHKILAPDRGVQRRVRQTDRGRCARGHPGQSQISRGGGRARAVVLSDYRSRFTWRWPKRFPTGSRFPRRAAISSTCRAIAPTAASTPRWTWCGADGAGARAKTGSTVRACRTSRCPPNWSSAKCRWWWRASGWFPIPPAPDAIAARWASSRATASAIPQK